MAQVGVTEASRLARTSRTQLYRLMKSGKLSFVTDAHGERRIDTEELLRVFGTMAQPVAQPGAPAAATLAHHGTAPVAPHDTDLVAMLKAQLEEAKARERWYQDELTQAQERLRQLALPAGGATSWWKFWK